MTTMYVDANLKPLHSQKIWGGSSSSAEIVPSALAFKTIADALAAATANDVIRIATGSYTMPATWKSVRMEGLSRTETILTGTSTIASGTQVVFENLAIDVALTVNGRLGVLRCQSDESSVVMASTSATSGDEGAVVYVDVTGPRPVASNFGAIAWYPPSKFVSGGAGGLNFSRYRTQAYWDVPAKYRNEADDSSRWVTLKTIPIRLDEKTGRENEVAQVNFANSMGMVYCRGGWPIHPDHRLRIRHRVLQVTGTAVSSQLPNEMLVMVNEQLMGV